MKKSFESNTACVESYFIKVSDWTSNNELSYKHAQACSIELSYKRVSVTVR